MAFGSVLTKVIEFPKHVAAKIQPMNFLKSVGHRHSLAVKRFTILILARTAAFMDNSPISRITGDQVNSNGRFRRRSYRVIAEAFTKPSLHKSCKSSTFHRLS